MQVATHWYMLLIWHLQCELMWTERGVPLMISNLAPCTAAFHHQFVNV